MTELTYACIPKSVPAAQTAERVRVAFVIDNMRLGGTELNAVRTAERLDRTRFDLRVICLGGEGPLTERYRAMGVPVIELHLRGLTSPSMVGTGLRFLRYLRRERIQIVHAHDTYSNVYATVWARAAGTPVVIASRRWWHSLPNRKLQLGNRVAFRLAHAVLANSAQVARSVHEEAGVPSSNVWTVTNFVGDDAFVPLSATERTHVRRGWRVPDGTTVIGCVARLDPVKDHPTLIRAFASLREQGLPVHLVLIGDGDTRDDLELLVAQLGLRQAVTFVGEVRDGQNHHRAFDISVLASLSEGFPNTLIEAMAAGVPVVSTAVGGSVDAVVHGSTGLLVPPARPDALAAALRRLVDDPGLRASFGAAGKARASEVYRADTVVESLQRMYVTLSGAVV